MAFCKNSGNRWVHKLTAQA